MPNTPSKNLMMSPVEFVRDTARRLSADLKDMQGVIGRECRDMSRELRDIQQDLTTRIRRSSLHSLPSLPRIDLPRIGISCSESSRYASSDDMKLASPGDMESLLNDDEDGIWSNSPQPQLAYDDDDVGDGSMPIPRMHHSPALIRSPRSEAILKTFGEQFRKCGQLLGLTHASVTKTNSGMATPRYYQRELQERISAPPPSPSNFGLSASTK